MPARPFILPPPNICVCLDPKCNIPFGTCHCGCGQETSIASDTYQKRNRWKGYPTLWINGHQHTARGRKPVEVPFEMEGVLCRRIHLTQGQFALVDNADYEDLSKWNWCALWSHGMNSYYAKRAAHKTRGEVRPLHMSRYLMGLKSEDEALVDHLNGNTLDNRRKNLRLATHAQNARNRRTKQASKSGLKGVSWNSGIGMYVASIRIDGKLKHLGCGTNPEELHLLYRNAALEAWGEFARFE